MSFLKSLFSKSDNDSEDSRGIEKHVEYLKSLRSPAIALFASNEAKNSRIGGLPSLPDIIPWPEWQEKPLSFLCQIDLSEIPNACDRHGLATHGMLYFFYNQEQETWGFDPKDAGSWQVIYAPASSGSNRAAPAGLNPDFIFIEKPVDLTSVETFPDWQDDRITALGFGESESKFDEYDKLCTGVFNGQPEHHLFGHASAVQNLDMDLECQFVTNGLYGGDPSGYSDPRAKELEAGRLDWIMLLQLDTDDAAGMMWGDCGKLYFWIRKDDLKNGRFDKCWMILQCS